jgi:hypothetical protein
MKKSENSAKKQLNKKQTKEDLLLTYEDLLFKKEQFMKDAESYRISYIQEFGELTAEVFKAKIECIRLKKTITFCQKSLNVGKKIDVNAMDKAIEGEMLVYKAELQSMLEENKIASKAISSDRFDVTFAKKIFRRLTKKLHPDINKMTEKDPRLEDLWNKIMRAYRANDVERLEELEVLVNAIFKELGEDAMDIDYKDLEDRIKALEIKIKIILSEKPYTYGELLNDEEKVKAKKKEMEKELKEYQDWEVAMSFNDDYVGDSLLKKYYNVYMNYPHK